MDLLKKMPNGVLQACATFLHNFGHNFGYYHQYNFEYDHHHLIRSPPPHHHNYHHQHHHHHHHYHHQHHHYCRLKLVRHFTGLQSLLSTLQQAYQVKKMKRSENIARGTTDPEIDSVTWIKFSNNMAPLAFVTNLATRWRHLQ